MLDRLKSLPLTIILTILIWMYAEAQFATTANIALDVKILSPSPDLALRVESSDNPHLTTLSLSVALQGPRDQIDKIRQESLPQELIREAASANGLAALSYAPDAKALRAAAGAGRLTVNTTSVLNGLDYFRSRGVTVTNALPPTVLIRIDRVEHVQKSPEFRPLFPTIRYAVDPPTVDVAIPADTLTYIGGQGRLAVVALAQNDRDVASLKEDVDQDLAVRFVVFPDPHDDRIRIIPSTGKVTVRIARQQQVTVNVPDVPIWIAGPPALLARYDVDVEPKTVSLTVSGPKSAIDALHQQLDRAPNESDIHAFLDLSPDDRPSDTAAHRSPRFALPPGLTLVKAPPDVAFRLSERSAPPANANSESPAPASRRSP